MRVPIQLPCVVTIDLGQQRVEKASPTLARTLDQLQVVRPEEHDPKRPDRVARAAWDPVDGELPRRSRASSDGAEVDADLQLFGAGVGLHAAGDAGGGLAESHQLGRLLRARGTRSEERRV